jgi:hypothetical protein
VGAQCRFGGYEGKRLKAALAAAEARHPILEIAAKWRSNAGAQQARKSRNPSPFRDGFTSFTGFVP